MKRLNRVRVLVFVALSGFGVGCDAISLDPPLNPELAVGPSTGATVTERAGPSQSVLAPQSGSSDRLLATDASPGPTPTIRGIELIFSRPDTSDREYLTQIVRKEAGKRLLGFRLTKPETGEPMTTEAMSRAIRRAAEMRHGVILEPRDAPEVCAAVRLFQATGLGIVLLDDRLTCAGQALAVHRIMFTGFQERGEAIVAAAFEEATLQQMPADGSIAILRNRTSDAYSSQKLASLTEALERRNRSFDIVTFDGSKSDGISRLTEYFQSHPRRSIVLAEDHTALLAAYKSHEELTAKGPRAFVLAGYALSDVRAGFPGHAACVAFAYPQLDAYSRKAIEIVANLSRGKSVPMEFDCELAFIRTRSNAD